MSIKPLPRNVKFTERDAKTRTRGKVIDVSFINEKFKWGDYRKEAQLIQWENGAKSLRFGYYVKNHGTPESEYSWGSQTTLILKVENAERFLRQALTLIKKKGKGKKRRRLTSSSS